MKKMKKILIICTAGLGTGGITTHIYNYASKLTDILVIDVIRSIYYEETVLKRFQESGCNVIDFPDRKKRFLQYLICLIKTISRNKYEVIHVHGNSATMGIELFVAQIMGIKTRIAHCHTSKTEHPFLHRIMNPIFSKTYNTALACSEMAGEWIFGKNNFAIIRNAIDANKYSFDNIVRKKYRKQFFIDDDTVFVVQIGSLIPLKNCEFSIEVISKINGNVKFIFVGDGPQKQQLEKIVIDQSLQDKVFFCGVRNDVDAILQAADVLLMPSHYEGLPLTLVEAQAAGVYCFVSSNITDDAMINSKLWIKNQLDVDQWGESLLQLNSFSQDRECAYKKVIESGFDIGENLKIIKDVYRI